jgi:hypothetical protein
MCATNVSFSQAILPTVKKVSDRPGIGKITAIFSCTSLYLARHPRMCRDTKPATVAKSTAAAVSGKHSSVAVAATRYLCQTKTHPASMQRTRDAR